MQIPEYTPGDTLDQFLERNQEVFGTIGMLSEYQTAKQISLLERIATSLEKLSGDAPTNCYGETLSEGIQNAHVRGLRGIPTYR